MKEHESVFLALDGSGRGAKRECYIDSFVIYGISIWNKSTFT